MKVLLHICCGPCSVMPLAQLRGEGLPVKGFFYNPNIHPYTEWQKRLDALSDYASQENLELIVTRDYHLEEFLKATISDPRAPQRCAACYRMRLDRAAKEARDQGLPAFTTTLLVSPYQQHDLIRAEAQRAAEKHGVEFLYRDWRPLFREGMARARSMSLYLQKYCGCIYSERDRFEKAGKGRG